MWSHFYPEPLLKLYVPKFGLLYHSKFPHRKRENSLEKSIFSENLVKNVLLFGFIPEEGSFLHP